MIPHRTPSILPWLYPSLHWRLPSGRNELYLTFDDGPVPGPTEFVLGVLHRYSVKATFFCIGDNIGKHPALFQRLVDEGHKVGNHTYHHLNGWRTRPDAYLEDVRRCDDLLYNGGGKSAQSRLFRPPYGRITRKQIGLLTGRPIIMWDVLSADYRQRLSAEKSFRNTLRAVRPGSIIVYHDSHKAERNLRYGLPRIIEECLGQGYTFSRIPL